MSEQISNNDLASALLQIYTESDSLWARRRLELAAERLSSMPCDDNEKQKHDKKDVYFGKKPWSHARDILAAKEDKEMAELKRIIAEKDEKIQELEDELMEIKHVMWE